MHCIALYPGSFLGKSLGARGVTNHWTEVDWTGLRWTGLDWTEVDWTGLDWTGLTKTSEIS